MQCRFKAVVSRGFLSTGRVTGLPTITYFFSLEEHKGAGLIALGWYKSEAIRQLPYPGSGFYRYPFFKL